MSIRLLQNCIENRHLFDPVPGFESLDFRHNPRPGLREFQVFDEIFAAGVHRTANIVGAVSSRFHAKGLLNGHDVKRWINDHPGYDVYVVNPRPQNIYLCFNNFDRGQITHQDSQLQQRYQEVLNLAGVDLDIVNVGRQHHGNYGMCSYWFGSERFWTDIMEALVLPVIRLSRSQLGDDLYAFLHAPTPYWGVSEHRAGALPHLLERATSLFINTRFQASAIHYARTREEILACCLYPFERELVETFGDQVDGWDRSGCYDDAAMAYFRHANQHAMHGRLAYMTRFPLDFGNGDPRPRFPWFQRNAVTNT
ncbi:hypothetical protein [Hydrogenophaga sp. PAMC20947]|uniref:hypothetical protein n=1 Tax=Hydrogenophaga sp. PAMC20947 TaxID=2565558 RepID=UPI00109D83E4|nr:hypothetical protein [Hydrogenophaga sp. PAMC20947]QCB46998.1 hypothetical protein E5678_13795 [Hydrogenophaga sp. PAMC20947]